MGRATEDIETDRQKEPDEGEDYGVRSEPNPTVFGTLRLEVSLIITRFFLNSLYHAGVTHTQLSSSGLIKYGAVNVHSQTVTKLTASASPTV